LRWFVAIVKHDSMAGQRRAVVVGGGSGIGADVARLQRDSGLEVLTWDIAGGDLACDVTDPDQIDAAAAETLDRLGVPDTVTVTAGIGHSAMLSTVTADEWDRVMAVNVRGVLFAMRALALPMLDTSGGSIVATSSVSSRLVDRGMGAYCASKAALDMVVRVAAAEWAPEVRVNAVAPGVTDTPMLGRAPRDGDWLSGVQERTALGGLGASEDVARAVLALHDLPWVTGQVLQSDGGLSLHSPINSFAHRPRSGPTRQS
jgi:NAD(P)-dependent dehydrogenase (short-subunit alcohol dehydrogenase family)